MIRKAIVKLTDKIGNFGMKIMDIEDKEEITFLDYFRFIPGAFCLLALYFIEALVFPPLYLIKKIKGEDTSSFWKDEEEEDEKDGEIF